MSANDQERSPAEMISDAKQFFPVNDKTFFFLPQDSSFFLAPLFFPYCKKKKRFVTIKKNVHGIGKHCCDKVQLIYHLQLVLPDPPADDIR